MKIQCDSVDTDSLEAEVLVDLPGNLYITVREGDSEACICLSPETAAQLRDALTEWLEGCNHG